MKKPVFKVRCGDCGERHPSVIQSQECFAHYEYDFQAGQYTLVEIIPRGYGDTTYHCSHCGCSLDNQTAIEAAING